jgi:hypothetical protein
MKKVVVDVAFLGDKTQTRVLVNPKEKATGHTITRSKLNYLAINAAAKKLHGPKAFWLASKHMWWHGQLLRQSKKRARRVIAPVNETISNQQVAEIEIIRGGELIGE